MKKFFILILACFCVAAFAQEPTIKFSGNVYTGLRADISESSQQIYANEDSNGTPIWANFRMDYAFDGNAGATLNFRIKGTDVLSKTTGSTFYPFLNRGFVWITSPDKMFRVRSGFLWDLDFESSANAWDTASSYCWTTELVAFPVKGLELGAIIPTPVDKMGLMDAIMDITYGAVYSSDKFRFSTMMEAGHISSLRSINFGIDYTGIKNTTMRFEGDIQQPGIDGTGYYQLYQQLNYVMDSFTPDIQVTETFYKDGSESLLKVYPNITIVDDKMTYFAGYDFRMSPDFSNLYNQIKLYSKFAINSKAYIKPGFYVTKDKNTETVFSPFIEFFASF